MTLSIATYNVLDLFDPDPADLEGPAAMAEKLSYLAKKIDELDADVVGLQEIGSERLLEELTERLSSAKGRYARVVGTPDARGIRCALLTRLPIVAAEILTTPSLPFPVFVEGDASPFGERLPLRRGIVQVTVESGGALVHVLVVHFKSGRPTPLKNGAGDPIEPTTSFEATEGSVRAMVFRAAEALFVRRAVDGFFAKNAECQVAVIGDFNDVYSSIVFRTVRGVLGSELFDAARSIPYEKRHTILHAGVMRAIDHVLVSAPLQRRIAEAKVFNDDLRDQDVLRAEGVTRFYDSDHSPLVVRFS